MRVLQRLVLCADGLIPRLVDHCCFAWNRLTDQPWRIMTLGLRTWAHRS